MTTKWKYRAEFIAACNCDWGCPCNFNARPTNGFCQGVYGVRIVRGLCGDVPLDGIKYAWGAKWPGAIHEGGGTARLWIEETAGEPQRRALEEILTGKLGGTPWSILASTIDRWLETAYVPFEWQPDGPRSSYKAGTEVQATLDPMRNLVTGLEAAATIMLPNGIVAKQLEVTTTRTFAVYSSGLKFAAPGKHGFYATAEHGN